jgi:glyceraldehyde 3-phosphate dehydrogenase
MPVRVGINGFGRIGRNVFRAAKAAGADVDFVAVNDLTDAKTLAHLLKYDSILGPYPGTVEVSDDGLSVDGDELQVSPRRDPASCRGATSAWTSSSSRPASSRPRRRRQAPRRPARRRSSSPRPAKGEDITVVLGVNFDQYDRRAARRHLERVVHDELPAPFAEGRPRHRRHQARPDDDDPRLHGRPAPARPPHTDLRRARAAALNLVPTSTGAAKAVGLVLPELNGKLHGYAIRAPVPTGSVIDLTFEANGPTSVDAVNGALREAAEGPLKGILAYTEDPIVSTDIVTDPHSAIVDGQLTAVIDETLVKVVAWYDNEWGYSNRLADLVQQVLVPATTTA